MKRYREGGRQTEFETERELTFLHHSLQDVHVIFLSHSAERRQLGLGNELQQLERERERENRQMTTREREKTRLVYHSFAFGKSGKLRFHSGRKRGQTGEHSYYRNHHLSHPHDQSAPYPLESKITSPSANPDTYA